MIPEKTLEAVVDHQFSSMVSAMDKCDSLEVSGFGKFSFNVKKAEKRLEKYRMFERVYMEQMKEDLTEQQRRRLELKKATIEREIEILKAKLHES